MSNTPEYTAWLTSIAFASSIGFAASIGGTVAVATAAKKYGVDMEEVLEEEEREDLCWGPTRNAPRWLGYAAVCFAMAIILSIVLQLGLTDPPVAAATKTDDLIHNVFRIGSYIAAGFAGLAVILLAQGLKYFYVWTGRVLQGMSVVVSLVFILLFSWGTYGPPWAPRGHTKIG